MRASDAPHDHGPAPLSERPDRGRIASAEATEIVARVRRHYTAEVAQLGEQATWGSRLLTRTACLTLAVKRSLEEQGVDPAEALRIAADVNWRCYRSVANLSASVVRWVVRDPATRLRINVRLEQGFPYNDPGFEHVRVGPYAYDVRRCPMADFLVARGERELCLRAFCGMDFPRVEELWGARLTRTTTLAAGDDACRFRYEPVTAASRSAGTGAPVRA
ncbi:L-2-amino-thiazoline-4-carboxylic acid hydrolase [Actinomycetospora cinnamomea]|uniref:L-2-amino-thiazoline-4-carboxylic acid hydrolase-like protein n=1 Tax=Actinomycetospora cinnamomea TaxID=663609 RepID=A0A2U1F6C7_9PSEU|nr:L-2-amino-thiazoline-4-carboxylic acid hydrolase [Actinomycetospora cinnamomea]PVZ07702.1 L-2-amino-thiazoline-4-carboxylic acid hydrolase-like protein [Actinomycetospora cinnamomea]